MDKSQSPWNELVKTLKEQAKGYQQYHSLLKEKEKHLIRGDTKRLMTLVEKENRAVEGLDKIEQKRIKVIRECVGEGKEEQPMLTELLEIAPEEYRAAIEKEAVSLIEVLNSVASLNRSNAELIKEAIQFVNYNISLLSGGERENIYSENGRMRATEQKISGFLNRQV